MNKASVIPPDLGTVTFARGTDEIASDSLSEAFQRHSFENAATFLDWKHSPCNRGTRCTSLSRHTDGHGTKFLVCTYPGPDGALYTHVVLGHHTGDESTDTCSGKPVTDARLGWIATCSKGGA